MKKSKYELKVDKNKVTMIERGYHTSNKKTVIYDENKNVRKLVVMSYEDGKEDYPNRRVIEDRETYDEKGNIVYMVHKVSEISVLDHGPYYEEMDVNDATLEDYAEYSFGEVEIRSQRKLGKESSKELTLTYPDMDKQTFRQYIEKNEGLLTYLNAATDDLGMKDNLLDYEAGKYDFKYDMENPDEKELTKNDGQAIYDMLDLLEGNIELVMKSDPKLIKKIDDQLNEFLTIAFYKNVDPSDINMAEEYRKIQDLNEKMEFSLNELENQLREVELEIIDQDDIEIF